MKFYLRVSSQMHAHNVPVRIRQLTRLFGVNTERRSTGIIQNMVQSIALTEIIQQGKSVTMPINKGTSCFYVWFNEYSPFLFCISICFYLKESIHSSHPIIKIR